ncbi:MAG: zinc-binding dehydrogenase [Nitratireductor sp.]
MRALQLVSEKEVKVTDVPPPPPPGEGEVQLKIKVVALNHIDVWGWRGMAFAKRNLPMTVGAEASAEVVSIGPGVSNLKSGDLVAIYGAPTCGVCRPCREGRDNHCEHPKGVHGFHLDGYAQELANMPARNVVKAPEGLSDVAAAVAPVTFGTCEHMLFDNAKLRSGETVLIHAGGSGIGSAAIQLAKGIGCTVITTVGSDEKIEPCKALGADHVINYNTDHWVGKVRKITKKKGVDVVFEHVGKSTWAGSMMVLRRGGRLVTCGSTSGVSAETNLMMLFQQQLRLIGSFGCNMANLTDAMEKMAHGIVHPVIDTELEFGDLEPALERMEARKVFGKIIMRIND